MPAIPTPGTGAGIILKGDAELFRRLDQVAAKVRDKGIRRAIREGAKPIVRTARALVPARYGLLRETLGVRTRKYRRGGTIVAIIGSRMGETLGVRKLLASAFLTEGAGSHSRGARPAKYAHLVEKGTKPHGRGKRRGPWHWQDRGGNWHTFQGGFHPGAKAQPFLEPAFRQNRMRSMGAMRRELRRYLESLGK